MAPGKTIYPKVGVWYDEKDQTIHLRIAEQGLSTVSSNPKLKRGNPHLFAKLAKALRDAGVPYPPVE